MRKSKKLLKQIITELEKMPNKSLVCHNLSISRQTFYRWVEDDWEFAEAIEGAMKVGRDSVNDLAESKVVEKIKGGDFRATKYWLDNKHNDYKRPRPDNWFQQENRKHVPNEVMFVDFSTGKKQTLDQLNAEKDTTEPPDNPQQ